MNTMGYKSVAQNNTLNADHSTCLSENRIKNDAGLLVCPKREVFDPKTVSMPKMVTKNAPQYPVWSTMGGH
tara:strand:- start:250 stop:462 length:213 start_codon:yes stop_codon:yes gene_type:complete